jgi:hypothetical protein
MIRNITAPDLTIPSTGIRSTVSRAMRSKIIPWDTGIQVLRTYTEIVERQQYLDKQYIPSDDRKIQTLKRIAHRLHVQLRTMEIAS